jgi:hypothetical protein
MIFCEKPLPSFSHHANGFRKALTILRDRTSPQDPAALALSALGWVLDDTSKAERFLTLTGLTPDELRARLGERAVQGAVLDFLSAHEPDLLGAAAALAVPPQALIAARDALSGTRGDDA